MSYDETLAERIRKALEHRRDVTEKKMFGGLAFLLEGSMFCGIVKDELMVRVGTARYEEALTEPHVRPMDFTGRPARGYVFVAPPGLGATVTSRRGSIGEPTSSQRLHRRQGHWGRAGASAGVEQQGDPYPDSLRRPRFSAIRASTSFRTRPAGRGHKP